MITCNDKYRPEKPSLIDASNNPIYQGQFDASGSPNDCVLQRPLLQGMNSQFFHISTTEQYSRIRNKRPFSSSSYRLTRNRVRHNFRANKAFFGTPFQISNQIDRISDIHTCKPLSSTFYSYQTGTWTPNVRVSNYKKPNLKFSVVGKLSYYHLFKKLMLCFYEINCSNTKPYILVPELLYRITSLTSFRSQFAVNLKESIEFSPLIENKTQEVHAVTNLLSDNDKSWTQDLSIAELALKDPFHNEEETECEIVIPRKSSRLFPESDSEDTFDNACFQNWIDWDISQDCLQDESQDQPVTRKTLWENLELFCAPNSFMFLSAAAALKRPKKLKSLFLLARIEDDQSIDEARPRKVHFEEAYPFDGTNVSTSYQTYNCLEEPSSIRPLLSKATPTFRSCLRYNKTSSQYSSLNQLASGGTNEQLANTGVTSTGFVPCDVMPLDLIDITDEMNEFISQKIPNAIMKIRRMTYRCWKDRSKVSTHLSKCVALFSRIENILIQCRKRDVSILSVLKLDWELQDILVQARLALRSMKSHLLKIDLVNQNDVVQNALNDISDTFSMGFQIDLQFQEKNRGAGLHYSRISGFNELAFVKHFKSRFEVLSNFSLRNVVGNLTKAYQDMGHVMQLLYVAMEEFELAVIQLQEKLDTFKLNCQYL